MDVDIRNSLIHPRLHARSSCAPCPLPPPLQAPVHPKCFTILSIAPCSAHALQHVKQLLEPHFLLLWKANSSSQLLSTSYYEHCQAVHDKSLSQRMQHLNVDLFSTLGLLGLSCGDCDKVSERHSQHSSSHVIPWAIQQSLSNRVWCKGGSLPYTLY